MYFKSSYLEHNKAKEQNKQNKQNHNIWGEKKNPMQNIPGYFQHCVIVTPAHQHVSRGFHTVIITPSPQLRGLSQSGKLWRAREKGNCDVL